MTGYSNGNSFGASAGNSTGSETRWPVPAWKFGVGPRSMTGDRGSI